MKSIVEQIKKKSLASTDNIEFSTEIRSPFTYDQDIKKSRKNDVAQMGYCECQDPICAICGRKIRKGFKDFMFAGKKDV